MSTKTLPKITIPYKRKKQANRSLEEIQDLLDKLLPENICLESSSLASQQAFLKQLPCFCWENLEEDTLSVTFLCKHRVGAAHFFYDMVTRWLLPNKHLHSSFFFSSDFYLPQVSTCLLTVAQIMVEVAEEKDRLLLKKNQNIRDRLERQIRLGAHSSYHANRILEFKDLSPDKKTEMIQKKIGFLMQKNSANYDTSIVAQMQKFLVTSKEEFKNLRSYHHISRMISLLHIVRKNLQKNILQSDCKRHIIVQLLKTKLDIGKPKQPVLGIIVGMNFLQEYEMFEEKHFCAALQKTGPCLSVVKGSFLLDRNQNHPTQLLYLEVQKKSLEEWRLPEIQALRKDLPESIKRHIEYLTHPVFMPRNEEEVLRNIMVLAKQLKYVHDIPQIIINFDEQQGANLLFTVVFLRILKPGQKPVKSLLKKMPKAWPCRLERNKKVGTLRRKYPKEANVFSLKIPSAAYLQDNHYVDLYKARSDLFEKMRQIFGDMRDYNGGMLRKHTELLQELKSSLGKKYRCQHFFLEKLFFSLQPSEMRNLLSCSLLQTLFFSVLQCRKKKVQGPCWCSKQHEGKSLFVCIETSANYREKVRNLVQKEKYPSCELLAFSLEGCFGFVLLTGDATKKARLEKILRTTLVSDTQNLCTTIQKIRDS